MESRKMVLMILLSGKQWEQICRHSRGRRGWDEAREWPGNVYTPMCKIASVNLLYDSRISTQRSVTT